MLVTNIPNCWTLFRHIFNLGSFTESSGKSKNNQGHRQYVHNPADILGSPRAPGDVVEGRSNRRLSMWSRMRMDDSESKENIAVGDFPLMIWQHTQVKVEDEEAKSVRSNDDLEVGGKTSATNNNKFFVTTTVTALNA
jgi:hypothetical protein